MTDMKSVEDLAAVLRRTVEEHHCQIWLNEQPTGLHPDTVTFEFELRPTGLWWVASTTVADNVVTRELVSESAHVTERDEPATGPSLIVTFPRQVRGVPFAVGRGELSVDKLVHGFGRTTPYSDSRAVFEITNQGPTELTVTGLVTSCQCTTSILELPLSDGARIYDRFDKSMSVVNDGDLVPAAIYTAETFGPDDKRWWMPLLIVLALVAVAAVSGWIGRRRHPRTAESASG